MDFIHWLKHTNKSLTLINPNCPDDSWGTSAHTANRISVAAVALLARHNTLGTWQAMLYWQPADTRHAYGIWV
jgi:hypothetical protein